MTVQALTHTAYGTQAARMTSSADQRQAPVSASGRPQPVLLLTDDVIEPEGYEALARELGYHPTALLESKVQKVLRTYHIPLYDANKVYVYMNKMAAKNGMDWRWVPLQSYNKAVPMHILQRAKIIRSQFPDSNFFVSDFTMPEPKYADPFMCAFITHAGAKVRLIFGMWDEPDFLAENEEQ